MRICMTCGQGRHASDFRTGNPNSSCRKCRTIYSNEWKRQHPEKIREYKKKHRELINKYAQNYRLRHPERAKESAKKCRSLHKELISQKHRERRIELKKQVFSIYGNTKCAICGETDLERLTLDHSNGDGGEFRKPFKEKNRHMSGYTFYCWLQRRGFPGNLGLRVLCMKCNYAEYVRSKKSA